LVNVNEKDFRPEFSWEEEPVMKLGKKNPQHVGCRGEVPSGFLKTLFFAKKAIFIRLGVN
jgi:hypothetical protein